MDIVPPLRSRELDPVSVRARGRNLVRVNHLKPKRTRLKALHAAVDERPARVDTGYEKSVSEGICIHREKHRYTYTARSELAYTVKVDSEQCKCSKVE